MQRLIGLIKQNQPIAFTGFARHVGVFLTNPVVPRVYQNPRFHGEGNGVVIYCVHGTADGPAAFSMIASRLINQGLSNRVSEIRLVDFGSRYQGKSIRDFAEQLSDTIRANGHDQVLLFGHSRGGVVAACFAEEFAGKHNINVLGLFAISSPFKGSHLAIPPLSVVSKSVQEMQRDSEFLINLCEKVRSSSVPYYFILAKNDGIVLPVYCHVYPHSERPDNVIQFDRHGHASILSSHRLIDYLCPIINQSMCPQAPSGELSPAAR